MINTYKIHKLFSLHMLLFLPLCVSHGSRKLFQWLQVGSPFSCWPYCGVCRSSQSISHYYRYLEFNHYSWYTSHFDFLKRCIGKQHRWSENVVYVNIYMCVCLCHIYVIYMIYTEWYDLYMIYSNAYKEILKQVSSEFLTFTNIIFL